MDIRPYIPGQDSLLVDAAARFHAGEPEPRPAQAARLQIGAVILGPVLDGPRDAAGAWARFRDVCGRGSADVFAFASITDLIGVQAQAAFDMAVIDVANEGGPAGIAALRASGCTLPVVALTSPASAECNARALAAGADLFLCRPVRETDLVQALGFCAARRTRSA